MFNITEQRLTDQQSQIRKKHWLTKLELQEIQKINHMVMYQMIAKVKMSNGYWRFMKKVVIYF